MEVTWLGHSCFKISDSNYHIILDPYEPSSVPGLNDLNEEANEVICSHEHFDHNSRDSITLVKGPNSPFIIETLPTYHDEVKGQKRGPNNITIIQTKDYRIAHLGDLGCDIDEYANQLKNLDVLLIPVGGFYTIDSQQAHCIIEKLQPRIVIPMHYRNQKMGFGFDNIDEIHTFTNGYQVTYLEKSYINLTSQFKTQIVVLRPSKSL